MSLKKMYDERGHAEAAGWAGLGVLIGMAVVVVIVVIVFALVVKLF